MPDCAAAPLVIRLFGPFEVRLNGVPLPRPRTRKAQWLLSLLALRQGTEVERTWLAGMLWPDSPEPQASGSLRNSLADLRGTLGPELGLLRAPTLRTLCLDRSGTEIDVLDFDAAIARGDCPSLEKAVALYRGPLLEGCGDEWAFQERQAREQAYLMALETLAALAMAQGEQAVAERHLRRAVGVDPLRESAKRVLMQALAAGGNYSSALLVYRELRLLLHRELNTEPDPETKALFEQIRAEVRRKAALGTPRPVEERAARMPGGQHPPHPRAGSPSSVQAGREGEVPGAATPSEERGSIVLLYKRRAQPDERLLGLLETRLAACGFRVFIDRHLTVGVEWAREIEREVRTADAVILLLSAASVTSEMLQYELQIAQEAAQRGGKPRLLPVRVDYPDALPEPLAGILDPLQHAIWSGAADDERLVADLLCALESPAPPTPAVLRERLEPVGGAVPLASAFYVVRPADEEFRAAIAGQDSIVLIKGARQMGKTSLLARGLHQARKAGSRVVRTDFQMLNAAHLETLDALFLKLADSIADQLDLEVDPEEVWHPRRGPSENLKRYWERVALRAVETPIVWGLDEVDRLFGCDFASEVFGLFRAWHNDRALDPEGPWHRLTLAIAYATEPYLFITDANQSPFNVGTRLTLEDFTFEQVADLNERYGSPLQNDAELTRTMRLLGGQPYLVRRGLHQMVTRDLDLSALEAKADRDDGIFGDHLRRMLVMLARKPDLCDVVREVLQGRPCPTEESFYRLRSAGVVTGESVQEVRPRCQLYAAYLARHLL